MCCQFRIDISGGRMTNERRHSSTLPRSSFKGTRSRSASVSSSQENKRNSYQRLERHASQVNMNNTTVPQAIISQNLGSRHAPTRRSLRHSRMVVLSKSGAVPRKYLPPVVEKLCLGIALAVAQLLYGAILTGLAGWLLIWSPHLEAQDVPHYSGLSFLLSGWIGIMLMTCCRYSYPGTTNSLCVFSLKPHHIILNVLFSSFSVLVGTLAFIFHVLHLVTLFESLTFCKEFPLSSPEWFSNLVNYSQHPHSSCYCYNPLPYFKALGKALEYHGLSCSDVLHTLPVLLGLCSVLNLLASSSSLWFVILLLKEKKPSERTRRKDRPQSLVSYTLNT